MKSDFVNENLERIKKLEETIHYTFKDKKKLLLALTHSSYANEKKHDGLASNERLEFLGDAVLNIITSEYIYNNHPSLSEGEMTKMRAALVCEASLVKCSSFIMLGNHLFLGKGEEATGGRTRPSILSDAFEALIGAVYLDGGLDEARRFVYEIMEESFSGFANNNAFTDYKTQFQEIIQKQSNEKITYSILEEKGPDHDKEFVVQVSVGDKVLGTGKGKSKKEAEQNAAKVALEKMQVTEWQ